MPEIAFFSGSGLSSLDFRVFQRHTQFETGDGPVVTVDLTATPEQRVSLCIVLFGATLTISPHLQSERVRLIAADRLVLPTITRSALT